MTTALELLNFIKSDLSEEKYNVIKNTLEAEIFREEFEEAFRISFEYDLSDLRNAISKYNNEEKDKTYFITNLYWRKGLKEFLNKYWDKMDQIITMVSEKINKMDEEK